MFAKILMELHEYLNVSPI